MSPYTGGGPPPGRGWGTVLVCGDCAHAATPLLGQLMVALPWTTLLEVEVASRNRYTFFP